MNPDVQWDETYDRPPVDPDYWRPRGVVQHLLLCAALAALATARAAVDLYQRTRSTPCPPPAPAPAPPAPVPPATAARSAS